MVAGRYEREANLFAACLLMSKLEQKQRNRRCNGSELSAALFLPAESIEEYFKKMGIPKNQVMLLPQSSLKCSAKSQLL